MNECSVITQLVLIQQRVIVKEGTPETTFTGAK